MFLAAAQGDGLDDGGAGGKASVNFAFEDGGEHGVEFLPDGCGEFGRDILVVGGERHQSGAGDGCVGDGGICDGESDGLQGIGCSHG